MLIKDPFEGQPYGVLLNPNSHPDGFDYHYIVTETPSSLEPLMDKGFHKAFIVLPYGENFNAGAFFLEAKTVEKKFQHIDLMPGTSAIPTLKLKAALDKKNYIRRIEQLKQHIHRGDIYEVNFCMEFFAEPVSIDSFETYKRLNALSQAPFSAFVKLQDSYIICSSPERFLKRTGNRLFTQPIKGTAKRGATVAADQALKEQLATSLKEQTENVMIVDVSRNDLSRVAAKGSVRVDELFGIHSYKQVHQMVSTISCTLKPGSTFNDIMQATFPMASMTGAPKERATQLIRQYEPGPRGFYSGCIGYINGNGDFDLNVVIRSIVYNSRTGRVSCHVGSAITTMCDAEAEYEECMLKAGAMLQALNATIE